MTRPRYSIVSAYPPPELPETAPPSLISGWLRANGRTAQAWITERTVAAEVRILRAHQALSAARADQMLADLKARREISQQFTDAAIAERDATFWETYQRLTPAARKPFLEAENACEALLGRREALRRERTVPPPVPVPPPRPAPEEPPRLQPYVSDQAISQIAARSFARLGHLRGQAADEAWGQWRRQLTAKHFSPAVEQEIIAKVAELRNLAAER